ncbi:MAG: phage terminase small subunit P27 family [Shewanella sp.]
MPKRKPTELKKLQGNPGKRKLNKDEPKFSGSLSACPTDLKDDERIVWDYIIASAPPNLFTNVDVGALRLYVIAFALHKKAHEEVLKQGAVIAGPQGGMMKNPWLEVMNKQAEVMIKAGSDLGFSPASRTKISIDNGGPEKASKFGRVIENENVQ